MALKLIVSQKELSRKLKAVNSVIKPKNFIPVFDNILLDSNKGLFIFGSDGTSLIKASVDCIECYGPMQVCIPAKTILSAIKELSDQPIEIIIDDDYNITIKYQAGHFDIKGLSPSEYPIMVIDGGLNFSINYSDFISNIKKAKHFCAADELRPVLNGVFFEINNTGITFAASDATKLCRIETKSTFSEKTSAIISSTDAKLISDIFEPKHDITITISSKNSRYTSGDFEIISRNIEGRYPNVNAIIPVNQPHKFQLNRSDLISAVRRVSLFSSQVSRLIVCIFEDNLKIESRDTDFALGAEEFVNMEHVDGRMKIGFNANMLLDILSSITTDSVSINLTDATKACVLRGVDNDNELYLLMPTTIN